jgi:hypothetical protein
MTMYLFLFAYMFFFPLSPTRLPSDLTIYRWVTRWLSYKKEELAYPSRAPGFNPCFLKGPCCSSFSFLCCVLFLFLSVFALCRVCPMLTLSLDFPFLIVPSSFSYVFDVIMVVRLMLQVWLYIGVFTIWLFALSNNVDDYMRFVMCDVWAVFTLHKVIWRDN